MFDVLMHPFGAVMLYVPCVNPSVKF